MQPLNSNSVFYAPAPIPTDSQYLTQYIANELIAIQSAINALAAGHLDKVYAVPAKLRDGDIRYADGTTWNPGAGRGIYFYDGTNWLVFGGSSGSVTSVTATTPIVSSGGTAPVLSISAATASVSGSMSATDKAKLDAISGTNTGDQTYVTGNAGGLSATLVVASGGTGLTSSGTSGNVLTSIGTGWVSSAPSSGGISSGKAIALSLVFSI